MSGQGQREGADEADLRGLSVAAAALSCTTVTVKNMCKADRWYRTSAGRVPQRWPPQINLTRGCMCRSDDGADCPVQCVRADTPSAMVQLSQVGLFADRLWATVLTWASPTLPALFV
eukprot:352122-Chlamydomonas_euryale.AAC.13